MTRLTPGLPKLLSGVSINLDKTEVLKLGTLKYTKFTKHLNLKWTIITEINEIEYLNYDFKIKQIKSIF